MPSSKIRYRNCLCFVFNNLLFAVASTAPIATSMPMFVKPTMQMTTIDASRIRQQQHQQQRLSSSASSRPSLPLPSISTTPSTVAKSNRRKSTSDVPPPPSTITTSAVALNLTKTGLFRFLFYVLQNRFNKITIE